MIAEILVIGSLVAAAAHAGVVVPAHGGGSSTSTRQQDDYGNYAFNYQVIDPLGATNGRWESGDGYGNKRGSYTLTDIDGRSRRVEYVADGHGFRAVIKTNEPGTAASAPAAAVYNSPYSGPLVHSAAVAVKAPVAHLAPAYAAPIAAYARPAYGIGPHAVKVAAPAYHRGPYYGPHYY